MELGRTLELVQCVCMAMASCSGRVDMSDSEEAPALNKGEITYGVNCSVRKWMEAAHRGSVLLFTVMASTGVGTC